MKMAARVLFIALLLCVSLLGIWRVLATGMSDHLAASNHPRQALDWDANNPGALVALARQQREQGELAAAATSARALLQREPLNGSGFVILANTAVAGADKTQAAKLSVIAIRRAPYALMPRAWLAREQLDQGNYSEALENIDEILRLSPAQQTHIFPILVALSTDSEFADALALTLAKRPTWRGSLVNYLMNSAGPEQMPSILSALQQHGGLDAATTGRWIDRLVKDGKWGEAYARWAAGLHQEAPARLRHVYNGDFEAEPGNTGFDWRIGDSAGVLVDRPVGISGDGSHALRLTFLGRRVESIPVHHWLMLAPGGYRLAFAASAQDLRGDRGLQWLIRCLDDGRELAASELVAGNFAWKRFQLDFVVPAQACIAQDLQLRNAGAAGAGKIIGGTLMVDDFEIEQVHGSGAASR